MVVASVAAAGNRRICRAAAIGSVAATSVVEAAGSEAVSAAVSGNAATVVAVGVTTSAPGSATVSASACVGSAAATVSTATGASAFVFVLAFRGGLVSPFDRSRTHRHRRQQRLTGGVAFAQLLFGGNGSMNLLQLLREASIEYR